MLICELPSGRGREQACFDFPWGQVATLEQIKAAIVAYRPAVFPAVGFNAALLKVGQTRDALRNVSVSDELDPDMPEPCVPDLQTRP